MGFMNYNMASSLLEFPFRIADTIRGNAMADELNRMAKEGREAIRPLRDERFKAEMDIAGNLRDQLTQNTERSFGNQRRNLGNFASNFFDTPSRSAAGAISQAEIGKGGLSGLVEGAGKEFMGNLRETEQARVRRDREDIDSVARILTQDFNELKSTLNTSYSDIVKRTDDNISRVQTQVDKALAEARTNKASALGEIMDDTAYTVASSTASIAGDLSQAKSRLQQAYAGQDMSNPEVSARYNRELQQLERGYRNQVVNTTIQTKGQFSKLKADIATQHDLSINQLHETSIGAIAKAGGDQGATLSAAYGSYSSALQQATSNFGARAVDLQRLRQQSGELMSTLFAQGEASVFGAQVNAYQYDADVLRELTNGLNTLENNAAMERNFRDVQYANLASSAWANYGTTEMAWVQSMINAEMEMVNWADPFDALTNDLAAVRQLEFAEMQARAADRASKSAWLSGAGSVMGGAGDIFSAFKKV